MKRNEKRVKRRKVRKIVKKRQIRKKGRQGIKRGKEIQREKGDEQNEWKERVKRNASKSQGVKSSRNEEIKQVVTGFKRCKPRSKQRGFQKHMNKHEKPKRTRVLEKTCRRKKLKEKHKTTYIIKFEKKRRSDSKGEKKPHKKRKEGNLKEKQKLLFILR